MSIWQSLADDQNSRQNRRLVELLAKKLPEATIAEELETFEDVVQLEIGGYCFDFLDGNSEPYDSQQFPVRMNVRKSGNHLGSKEMKNIPHAVNTIKKIAAMTLAEVSNYLAISQG